MPLVNTKYFGTLPYLEESVFHFPAGLPAFENETRFVPIELQEHDPLIFLQSLEQSELCFLAFPILVVDRGYRLAVSDEDLATIDLDTGRQPRLASEVMVLALLSLHDGFSATANLMSPIVVNLKTRRAVQAVRHDSLYSYRHPIAQRAQEEAC